MLVDRSRRPSQLTRVLADNGLSIALFSLFLICEGFHSLSGWKSYNESLAGAAKAPVAYGQFLLTGTFQDAILNNWQAAVLQLAVLVGLSTILRQKGAVHSRLSADERVARNQRSGHPEAVGRGDHLLQTSCPGTPRHKRPGERRSWVYRNSLSITLSGAFVLFLVLHVWTSNRAYNEEQIIRHGQTQSLPEYLSSPNLMATTLENWQAEFFAIATYIVLTIFLRQDRSPESKKVGAANSDTGDPNE